MERFQRVNNIAGWVVFAIAATVYLLTIESTASFWDCGEFISTAYKFEVGHPPGAPFFMLMAKFFTLFASDEHSVGYMVNVFSAIMSALTILFLFWTITHLAKKLVMGNDSLKGEEMELDQLIKIIGCGVVGALAYTFTDTFWFSAVEAEVYASSSMFTALVFWCILKWEDAADKPYANRWLVLIAYLMGLSIGVHLLNLLCIPALVLVYYFKKYEPTAKGMLISLGVSVVILAVILYGMIPGFVTVAGWFELFFVNTLGFSFNVGTIVYIVVLLGCLVTALYFTFDEEGKDAIGNKEIALFVGGITLLGIPFFGSHIGLGIFLILGISAFLFFMRRMVSMALLNTILLCATVILLGYSSYVMLVIRSSANPTMDQNSPDDVFALKSYLNRDQYGDTPLLYGETYASEVLRDKEGRAMFTEGEALYAKKIKDSEKEPDEYIEYDRKKKYHYDNQMLFPRMYSHQGNHIEAYKSWGGVKGKAGKSASGKKVMLPTFGDNMTYFFKYQIGFMYWRYFMWNFVGRQNDIQGHGEITNGNWISGIDFIDEMLVGPQDTLPDLLKNNKGRNTYYFLPLILGLLGILAQFNRGQKGMQSFWLTLTLFLMTGLAIVVYLNQYPYQPRERDYAYAGSFYAFCIWIGLGVLYIADLIEMAKVNKKVSATIAFVMSMSVPTVLAVQNWDDHDRSGRYVCRDYGANYLKTVQPQGLIFTNGDNDTFPLWYNQEVEGEGTDKRVANLSYLQMAWYVDQMQADAYESKAMPMELKSKDYSNGKLDVVYLTDALPSLTADQAFMFAKDPKVGKRLGYGGDVEIIPTETIVIPVDSAAIVKAGLRSADDPRPVEDIVINLKGKRYLGKQELFILDLIRSNKDWSRPIYFAVTVGEDGYMKLKDYLRLEGMAYRLMPEKQKGGAINTELMYDNMMNKFAWGNVKDPNVYMDENAARMGKTFRHMFLRLAEALKSEGKKDKAIAALDKCMEEIPMYNVSPDYATARIANLYGDLGESEKAQKIKDELFMHCNQYKTWFKSLDKKQQKSAYNDVVEFLGIMQVLMMADNGKEMNEEMQQRDEEFREFYEAMTPYLKN